MVLAAINVLQWIRSFLQERSQFVCINNCKSEKREVSSGVPQGSVLGPALFVYYINDLPQSVSNKVKAKMFADDTKNYKDIQSAESKEILQDSIEKLTDWTEKWLLQFNNQKCHVLHLGKSNPNYEYEMGE